MAPRSDRARQGSGRRRDRGQVARGQPAAEASQGQPRGRGNGPSADPRGTTPGPAPGSSSQGQGRAPTAQAAQGPPRGRGNGPRTDPRGTTPGPAPGSSSQGQGRAPTAQGSDKAPAPQTGSSSVPAASGHRNGQRGGQTRGGTLPEQLTAHQAAAQPSCGTTQQQGGAWSSGPPPGLCLPLSPTSQAVLDKALANSLADEKGRLAKVAAQEERMLAQEERMLKEALDNSLAEAQANPGARAAQGPQRSDQGPSQLGQAQAELQAARFAVEDVFRSRQPPPASGPAQVLVSGFPSQGGFRAAPAGDGGLMGSRLGAAGADKAAGAAQGEAAVPGSPSLRLPMRFGSYNAAKCLPGAGSGGGLTHLTAEQQQAAASARKQVQPAGGGRDLAGKLLQVEPIAGRGGGGPGAPAQAEQAAGAQAASRLGAVEHVSAEARVRAASIAALNEVGPQLASNSSIESAPLLAVLLHLQQHLGAADDAGASSAPVLLRAVRLLLQSCPNPEPRVLANMAALHLLLQHRDTPLPQLLCDSNQAVLSQDHGPLFDKLRLRLGLPRSTALEPTLGPLLQGAELNASAVAKGLREVLATSLLLPAGMQHPPAGSVLHQGFADTARLAEALSGAELAAGLDQPEGVVPTPSMVSTMLNDVRQLTQLLWGDAGRASRVLQLVARHAGTGSAAARMAGYPEPAGPSTSQRQLLGLLDSVLMMLLASSVPVPAGDEQGDTGALSVVLLTAVLKRLHSHHRTDALLVAEHFPSHLSTDPQARHMLAELDMKATRSVLPADMEKHRLLLDKVDTHWIPRAL